MFRLVTLLCLLLLWFMPFAAPGASETSPAFVRAVVTAPLEGDAPLRVYLDSDEPLCRKAYGEEWASRCFASPGREGAYVRGVRLLPEIPGEWRWDDGRMISFRPREPWPAGQQFELVLDDAPLPSRVKLTSSRVTFATPPLALVRMDADVWVCLLYTSPSPRDISGSRMPSSA